MARALKQREAELVLEAADRLAHGRLRNAEALGGPPEVTRLRDSQERGELPGLHALHHNAALSQSDLERDCRCVVAVVSSGA